MTAPKVWSIEVVLLRVCQQVFAQDKLDPSACSLPIIELLHNVSGDEKGQV